MVEKMDRETGLQSFSSKIMKLNIWKGDNTGLQEFVGQGRGTTTGMWKVLQMSPLQGA